MIASQECSFRIGRKEAISAPPRRLLSILRPFDRLPGQPPRNIVEPTFEMAGSRVVTDLEQARAALSEALLKSRPGPSLAEFEEVGRRPAAPRADDPMRWWSCSGMSRMRR